MAEHPADFLQPRCSLPCHGCAIALLGFMARGSPGHVPLRRSSSLRSPALLPGSPLHAPLALPAVRLPRSAPPLLLVLLCETCSSFLRAPAASSSSTSSHGAPARRDFPSPEFSLPWRTLPARPLLLWRHGILACVKLPARRRSSLRPAKPLHRAQPLSFLLRTALLCSSPPSSSPELLPCLPSRALLPWPLRTCPCSAPIPARAQPWSPARRTWAAAHVVLPACSVLPSPWHSAA